MLISLQRSRTPWQPGKALHGLDQLGLDADSRQVFLYSNAQRIFGL
jgi:predicted TIM-barrel fold metal-dependent hydrolase